MPGCCLKVSRLHAGSMYNFYDSQVTTFNTVTYPAEEFSVVPLGGLLDDEDTDGDGVDDPDVGLDEPAGGGGVDEVPRVLVPYERRVDGAAHAAAEMELPAARDGAAGLHDQTLRNLGG